MEVIRSIEEMRRARAQYSKSIVGFVPTMGYLHEGHVSLIHEARKQCDVVIVSVFVNPLQFAPGEDFATYPRDFEKDCATANQAGVDILFMPTEAEMYPTKPLTTVKVTKVTDILCGRSRPLFFDGVTTVVTKLFNIVQPDYAYFGLKDAQQVAVIQQMVNDLNMPVTIVPCPTMRERDGLAMSSRNVYLSAEERQQATILYKALTEASKRVLNRELINRHDVETWVKDKINSQPLAQIDYVELRTYPALEDVNQLEEGRYILAVAVKFGKTRLVDNVLIDLT